MPSKNHLHNRNRMGTEGIYVQLALLAQEQLELIMGKLEWKALELWYSTLELEMVQEYQVQLSDWVLQKLRKEFKLQFLVVVLFMRCFLEVSYWGYYC